MFHRFGNAVDQKGNALPGWQVECVLLADGLTVVPIYSDENETPIIGVSGVANRAVADGAGNYDYFVLDGNYSERFYDENGVSQGLIRYVSMYGSATEEIQDAVIAAELAAELAEATATAVIYETWTSLAAVTGTAGNTAIIFSQAGTHTDPVTSASVNNAGLYLWTTGWKRIADTQAVIAGMYADDAEASAQAAASSATSAAAAAEIAVAGQNIYATKADATADLANIAEGANVVVLADESESGARTVYQKTGGVLVLIGAFGGFTGGTLSTKLTTAASGTGGSGLNVQPGVAPTSPNNGDLWVTSTALYTRIGGTTRAQATIDGTETLTNKNISLGTNTVSATLAQLNSAVSDADLVSLAGTETLTNKTVNLTSNTLTGTKAQFNAVCSDGDFLFVGDLGSYALLTDLYGLQEIPIPATAMTPRLTNGPAQGLTETTTNKVMLATLDFDPSTTERAQIRFPMPKRWNEGTFTVQFGWTAAATGNVVWGCRAVAISDDDSTDAAFGTAVTVTDGVTAANDFMKSAKTAAITPGGTAAEGDVLIIEFYRDAASGSDTLNSSDARLLCVWLALTTNAKDDT